MEFVFANHNLVDLTEISQLVPNRSVRVGKNLAILHAALSRARQSASGKAFDHRTFHIGDRDQMEECISIIIGTLPKALCRLFSNQMKHVGYNTNCDTPVSRSVSQLMDIGSRGAIEHLKKAFEMTEVKAANVPLATEMFSTRVRPFILQTVGLLGEYSDGEEIRLTDFDGMFLLCTCGEFSVLIARPMYSK
jgi:hypothetical protein